MLYEFLSLFHFTIWHTIVYMFTHGRDMLNKVSLQFDKETEGEGAKTHLRRSCYSFLHFYVYLRRPPILSKTNVLLSM